MVLVTIRRLGPNQTVTTMGVVKFLEIIKSRLEIKGGGRQYSCVPVMTLKGVTGLDTQERKSGGIPSQP